MLPLTGIRVLDLTRLLPGPFATMVIADRGAGDWLRGISPLAGGESGAFHALNRGKRSIALDLRRPEGVSAFLRLARGADAVVESFRPGVLDRLGVGWEALHRENQRLVLCSISGYGQDGPYAQRAGHDLDYCAFAGVLAANGTPERPAALAMLALPLAMAWTRGTPISRGRELLDGGAACYAVYRARDGKFVALGALEPKFFAAFCAAVGRPELAERQLEDGGRGPRAELEAIFASRTRDEWADFGGRHDVCLAPVLEGDEPQADPQLAARGAFVGVPVPGQARRMPAVATPIRIRGAPPPPPTAGPRAGEHTDEVLAEAGFAADEIAALRRGGVLEA